MPLVKQLSQHGPISGGRKRGPRRAVVHNESSDNEALTVRQLCARERAKRHAAEAIAPSSATDPRMEPTRGLVCAVATGRGKRAFASSVEATCDPSKGKRMRPPPTLCKEGVQHASAV